MKFDMPLTFQTFFMCRIQEKLFLYSKYTSIPYVVVCACVWETGLYCGETESNSKMVKERL